jgi:pimeloyl-ACP methyl ester carboxylesterase
MGKSDGRASPVGRYFNVARRRLHLYISGAGTPAVVILPGGGAVGLDYLNIQARAAEHTTAVLYDRGGTGWSSGVSHPRTSAQVSDELRELLRAAGVPPPYVLLGHSLGGLFARHYAQRFPAEVTGLLLLDPAHEDYDAYMPDELRAIRGAPATSAPPSVTDSVKAQLSRLMSLGIEGAINCPPARGLLAQLPAIRRYRTEYRRLFAEEMADWPAEVRETLIERHVSLEWLWAGMQESQNLTELYDEVHRAGPMPDVLTVILCSTGVDGFRRIVSPGESDALLQGEIEGKRRLYDAIASSVTRGEVRLVDGGHFTMHFRAPDEVIQAIVDLLGWPDSPARPSPNP